MKNSYLIICFALLLSSCVLDEPENAGEYNNYPFRMEIDSEGADLADAEDYDIEIKFADFIGDLPSSEITLGYSLIGDADFSAVSIDEIVYVYEDDDCEYERSIEFDGGMITIPVDPDLGTVPEEFEIKVAFNLPEDEASAGGFKFAITSVSSSSNVLFNDANAFEYEILDNDVSGEWVIEFVTEDEFNTFKHLFSVISTDLAEISFDDITGEVKFEFEFEEMKIEVELGETEIVETCEDGEVESEEENLVIEIEAEYDAEDGKIEFQGSHFNEEGEELDFIMEGVYILDDDEGFVITFKEIIDEDNFGEDRLFEGEVSFRLIAD